MSSTAGSSQDDFLSNYGDVLYQFASHNERPADTPADTIERCVTETSDGKYVVETYNKSDFLQRILNIFKSRVDDLKPLKGMFEQILAKMQNSPELKAKYGSLVSRALQGMRRLYEQYRHDTSAEAAIKRNDILECLSVAIRPKGFNELIFQQLSSTGRIHGAQRLNACSERVRKSAFLIERIKALPLKQAQEVSEKSILYVCYKDLEKALTRLRAINNDNPSVEEIQRVLKETLHKEDVPFGAVIEALYAHRLDHETLNRLVTALQTLRFGKIDTPTTSEKFFQLFFTILSGRTSQLIHKDTITSVGKLVEFFQNLHISVETEYQGELYGYSEIFTGDLRDPKSHNEAFERGLTQEARQMFLQEAQRRQAQIQKETGTRSPVIISNSFNRLRFHELNEGEVAKRFNIVGKLLDFSEENMRATEEEQTHTGQFQFSLKEMLGVEGEVQNKDVVAAKDLQSDQAARLVLRSCASLVDREKVNMVIQRLAPQDIHHFYSSAKG
ncbi:MAG TPA: hypothetical protein VN457_08400, partial [Chlamydiales bacterium]|nr:hypothetical protein [Chlamydiales bacterium]